MLREVVCQVCLPRVPKKSELSLCFAVTWPVESHVHGLGAFWLNFIINYSLCCCVVSLNWGQRLRMSQFVEYLVEVNGLFGIYI